MRRLTPRAFPNEIFSHSRNESTRLLSAVRIFTRTDTRTDTKTDTRTDTKTDTRTDTMTDTSTDTKTDTRTDTKIDIRTDTKTDTSTDNYRAKLSSSQTADRFWWDFQTAETNNSRN